MKLIVNRCFGGFGLSGLAIKEYLKLKGKEAFFYKQTKYEHREGVEEYTRIDQLDDCFYLSCFTKDFGEAVSKFSKTDYKKHYFSYGDIERNDKDLIAVVEKLGEKANGQCAELEVVEIPDDIDWEISDYDGMERVEETHRSW